MYLSCHSLLLLNQTVPHEGRGGEGRKGRGRKGRGGRKERRKERGTRAKERQKNVAKFLNI